MEIIQRNSTKLLGINIDQNLNWKEHTELLANKLSKNLNIIRHIKYINKKALLKVYFTMIHPYLAYGNIIWNFNYKCLTDKIQKIPPNAIRLIIITAQYSNNIINI